MTHLTYLAILAGCLVASVVLELTLHIRVYRRCRRLVLAVAPVALIFTGWDLAASADHQWSFQDRWLIGVRLAGGLPIEEPVFFVVVAICAVSTLEAVRSRRPEWPVGDERERC